MSISYLKSGDKIALVATARKISEAELEFALESLKKWGLIPVLGKHIFAVSNQFAGTDSQRAEDLQWALDDPQMKAILIVRGGYGTIRILDLIDFSRFKVNPKWLIGYSDVTALHSHVHAQMSGLATIHATMPVNFNKNEEALESLKNCLFGKQQTYLLPTHALNRKGEACGVVVGGNLSLIFALTGTASDIDTNGKILFLEDLDEYLYHIDRMMLNLKRTGKLAGLKGLVIGGFTEMKDNLIPFGKNAEEIILDAVKEYHFPVAFNFPAGHVNRNLGIYLGYEVHLQVTNEGATFKYLQV